MRSTIQNREVETSGLQEAKTFTFAAGAKAFKIFIDGIYSDKIRAIIREYWTNAYDAHILVGKGDVPFTCQLPTLLAPELIVRDFGPGVSHERMMRDFTQAFLSSKDDSDDFVGALGLGRLSAFSYTDSFSVNTYIAGEKRSYVVFLNSSNIPELSLMSATPSEEEDGFEVRFPVKLADCSKFWRAAEFTSIGFSVKPIMLNQSINYPEAVLSNDLWSIYPFLEGVHAKQGCVIYPVDDKIVGELGDFEAVLSTQGLVINYPIGSLDFSASREALGYNSGTRLVLKSSFTQIRNKMVEDTLTEISKAKTWAEAASIFHGFKTAGLHRSILEKMVFNGKIIESRRKIYNSSLKYHKVILYAHTPKDSAKKFSLAYSSEVYFGPTDDSIVYAAKRGTLSITTRAIAHMREVNGYHVYIIQYDDLRGLERMRRIMGHPKIIDIASLPKPKVAPRKKKDASKEGYVRCFLPTNSGFSEGEVLIKDKGFYLTIDRGVLEDFSSATIPALCIELKKIGNNTLEDLIAINPSQVKRFEKSGWIEASSLIKETVYKVFNTEKYQHNLFCAFAKISDYSIGSTTEIKENNVSDSLGQNHPFTKALSEYYKIEKKIQGYKMSHIITIARMSSIEILPIEPPEFVEQRNLISELYKEFPMLQVIANVTSLLTSAYTDKNTKKILLDYLEKDVYKDCKLALAA